MPATFEAWTVLPHRPIEKLADNLWSVEGMLGSTQRRMTLARLRDGRIVVHNAVALDDAEMAEIDAWGTVAAIAVPNGFHRQDAKIWKARYPNARVYAPKGSAKRIAKVVAVDGSYDDAPADDTVRLAHLEGLGGSEGIVEIRSGDSVTLVFNDALMNMKKMGGPKGFLLGPTGAPAVSRAFKWFFASDKAAFRTHLERLAGTAGLTRIIVGHGKTIEQDAGERLREAAARL